MNRLILAVIVISGSVTVQGAGVAGPKDCTPSVLSMMRTYLIETARLKPAFELLDSLNCIRALDRFRESADTGDPAAQNNVGVIYESGLGVDADLDLARQWYRRAAEGLLAEAQWNLAVVIFLPHSNVSLLDALRPIPKPETPQQRLRYREALPTRLVRRLLERIE